MTYAKPFAQLQPMSTSSCADKRSSDAITVDDTGTSSCNTENDDMQVDSMLSSEPSPPVLARSFVPRNRILTFDTEPHSKQVSTVLKRPAPSTQESDQESETSGSDSESSSNEIEADKEPETTSTTQPPALVKEEPMPSSNLPETPQLSTCAITEARSFSEMEQLIDTECTNLGFKTSVFTHRM